ncbi:MAG: hypothetical protein QM831_46535 [Kofleriaceae bacterium]
MFDAFGLTRVTLSTGKAKHNKKVAGDWHLHTGTHVFGHGEVSNKRFGFTLPELTIRKLDDLDYTLAYQRNIGLAPNGTPFSTTGTTYAGRPIPPGKQLAQVSLGPSLLLRDRFAPIVVTSESGHFVMLTATDLRGGHFDGKQITSTWSAPVELPRGEITLRVGPTFAFASAYHATNHSAHCVQIVQGKLVRTAIVPALGPVDFDGERIAYQPDREHVHRRRFTDEVEEIFELPAAAHGIGEVMADGEHLLFVTPDRETILDLVTDDVIPRGLPDAERETRRVIHAELDAARAASDSIGANLHVRAIDHGRASWGWSEGDQSLVSFGVIGTFVHRMSSHADQRLRPGSWSNSYQLAPITTADMVRYRAALDAGHVEVLATTEWIRHAIAEAWRAEHHKPTGPRFEKQAGYMLVRELVGQRGDTPITAREIIAALDPVTLERVDGAAWLVFDVLEANARDVMVDWMVLRPSAHVATNPHVFRDVLQAIVRLDPGARSVIAAAIDAHPSQHSAYMKSMF